MKTIFAKYNSERLPKYQIVTKIVLDNDGQRYAIKEALCNEAKEHIEDIYKNYELLKNSHNLNLVKPTKIENGVMFEMAKGISLENILLEATTQNDKERFAKYIDKFLDLLDGMVTKRNTIFEPSEEFITIFGQWESNEPQDIIKPANIDLIFGNIFVNENDEFTLIDYEWVFDFEVPKSFVVWRSLNFFYFSYLVESKFNICKDYILSLLTIDLYKNEMSFYDFVYHKTRINFLDIKKCKQITSLDTKEQELSQTKQNLQSKEQELNQTKQNLQTKEQELNQTKQNLQSKEQELNQTKQELENIKTELANIYISRSWKLTRPLRRFMRIIKK